jgi:hypothetical protein
MRLLVSMGLKPSARPEEPLRPRLREVDVERGVVVRELAYEVSPEHVPGPWAHQEFTAASFDAQGLLLQPAHTEVLWIEPRSLRVLRVVSHPLFHGVHSAAPLPGGGIVVTCAGTESVLELDAQGQLARHWWLRAGDFASAYPGRTDLRRVDHDELKPHSHHPNHASLVGEELWVTCFETGEARALTSGRSVPLPESFPHDGRLRGGLLWFTQVDGRVVGVDPVTLRRQVELDLTELSGPQQRGLLGWCRGIEVVGSRMFVGLTMLRGTRHREVLRRLLRGRDGQKRPTRVVEIDLDRPRIVREIEVGNGAGGTIYSLLAAAG